MSIRDLARELYRAKQQVERLEKELAQASPVEEERLQAELGEAREEWRLIRNMIEGRKSGPALPRKY